MTLVKEASKSDKRSTGLSNLVALSLSAIAVLTYLSNECRHNVALTGHIRSFPLWCKRRYFIAVAGVCLQQLPKVFLVMDELRQITCIVLATKVSQKERHSEHCIDMFDVDVTQCHNETQTTLAMNLCTPSHLRNMSEVFIGETKN